MGGVRKGLKITNIHGKLFIIEIMISNTTSKPTTSLGPEMYQEALCVLQGM